MLIVRDILYLSGNEEQFTPDDDRLTDEICTTYAAALGDIDEDLPSSAQDDDAAKAAKDAIRAVGITLADEVD